MTSFLGSSLTLNQRSHITSSLVTVVIPVAESHLSLLPRAIHSLNKQIYRPQIIVVNDSEKRIEDYVFYIDDIDEIVNTGGHKGTAYSRNLGIDHVKTPLVTFLDADDYFLEGAVDLLTRAYLEYDTCYVYGDWYQYNERGYIHHKSKIYDRKRILKHSIHLVNILLETDVAKSVYYDINYRGWEDWKFHIDLAMRGLCGTRVPEPVVIYDMTTSINREKHNAIQAEVYPEILNQYQEYAKGAKEFMACATCGGNKGSMRRQVTVAPPEPQEGLITLEFTGQNTAPIGFRVNNHSYRGANDEAFKYVQVPFEDAQGLLNTGPWRKVVRGLKPVVVPNAEEFNQWREVNSAPLPENLDQFFKPDAVIYGKENQPKPEPKKRHRRTKAELMAARNAQANAN